ncbi:MAG: Gfo/Idh/MocA family oxidoreductase, partial [Clostridia bacterium]
ESMKKYAFAGASGRALNMFALPMAREWKNNTALVGVYDVNPVRAGILSRECGGVPIYEDFDLMILTGKPDVVIVTTVDAFHHDYIIRSLEAGCDVITEKPMTIDAEKCRDILAAEKKSGKRVIVTFNYRFAPYVTRIKELLQEGLVGTVLSIDFEWILDTSHGADYFRRWHRHMANSGGLLVHKSTHHFDLINWWLEEDPEEVYAFGSRRFYGATRDERGERCLTCGHRDTCTFFWDITKDPFMKKFYYEAEEQDGYYRDRCVFAQDIDIYDTMSVNVKYSRGALLSYSLVAHSPYEGWKAAINGSGGRLEVEEFHSGCRKGEPVQQIRYYSREGNIVTYEIAKDESGHGGGDERLRRMLFAGESHDPLGHFADSRAGAMSILTGIASNISIMEKKPVYIKDLMEQNEGK